MTNSKLLYNQIKAELTNIKKSSKYKKIHNYWDLKGEILYYCWEKEDGKKKEFRSRIITTKENFKKIQKISDKEYIFFENEELQEIRNQICQIRKLWGEQDEQNCRDIEEKTNSVPGLYYYHGNGQRRRSSWFDYGDKKGAYLSMSGNKNGRTHDLNINMNHPVLDNFSFQTGYYLIDCGSPIEKNLAPLRPWSDGGNKNPNNFHRWVEPNDEIIITPYNEKENIQLTLTAKPGNKKFLTHTFQTSNIKKVVLDNGELTLTYNNNNNKVFSLEQVNNDWELLPIKSYLEVNNRKELRQEELNINSSTINSYTPLWIGGAVGILIIGVVAIFLVRKKNRQKQK